MKELIFEEIKFVLGKNSTENFQLIDMAKEENENYWWFHLDNMPSGHCVIYSENPNKNQIKMAGLFVKENSKAKYFKKVPIIYTQLKNVKKTKTIGEVILKGNTKMIKI